MQQTPLSPEQLLDLAEPRAAGSVRIARKIIGQPEKIADLQRRWRKLSSSLAATAPVLLAVIIGGSLIQTDSSLVETVWEITAASMLIAGVTIAVADSRSFYLKLLDPKNMPVQFEEAQQLISRSSYAKAWNDFVVQDARKLHQFDLEIMWALATSELGQTEEDRSH